MTPIRRLLLLELSGGPRTGLSLMLQRTFFGGYSGWGHMQLVFPELRDMEDEGLVERILNENTESKLDVYAHVLTRAGREALAKLDGDTSPDAS